MMFPGSENGGRGRGADRLPRPFLKWAGGKGSLLPQLSLLFPAQIPAYHEPFVGGGAVFFHLFGAGRLAGRPVVLSDSNAELINIYRVVQSAVHELIASLGRHANTPEYYYAVRALDPAALDPVERASRMIYLNKTCYNGLWRVNRRGRFNVPFGRYRNPRICDAETLLAAQRALAQVQILEAPFPSVLDRARSGDFIYLDPPYHPLSETSRFTSYTAGDFGPDDQRRLARAYRDLDRGGCRVMLSNSDTAFVRELYAGFRIETVQAGRAINSKAEGRGPISEVVVLNY